MWRRSPEAEPDHWQPDPRRSGDPPGQPHVGLDTTRSVTLSAATRSSILLSMSPEAVAAKQREAVNLVLRGSLEEAIELLSTLAEAWRSMFGPDHPSTLTCQYWQGVCLARLGAGGQAMAMFASVSLSTRRILIQQQLSWRRSTARSRCA
ncbi:tetratricopeptide repeat protein [Streptomyces sp. NPDC006458]|uniref:tetratricopeptide repeat protein n=1 Tax=Streptomyces sp. NPDC006458 TaxID=3154302 RepID=UPI0033BB8263